MESPASGPAKLAETEPLVRPPDVEPTVNGKPWSRKGASPVNRRRSKTIPASDVGLAVLAYIVTEVTGLDPVLRSLKNLGSFIGPGTASFS